MPQPPPDLEGLLDDASFSELHERIIDAPIQIVWPHCLEVESRQVRTLGPLLSLRRLPSMLRGRDRPGPTAIRSLLDDFVAAGFHCLRRDDSPVGGRAVAIVGAAGRFWSVTGNAPIAFESPLDLLRFDEPGHAVTVARLEARSLPDGRTIIETETRVRPTDDTAHRRFRLYWAIIRLPSGLIRRSWLAAIERRVLAAA